MNQLLVLGTVGREKVRVFGKVSPVVYGGTAFHAVEAVLRAGRAQPVLVSAVGDDLTPEELVRQFSEKVSGDGLQRITGCPSFYWEAAYESSFEENVTLALENRLLDDFRPDWHRIRSRFPDIDTCYLGAFDPQVQIGCCERFPDAIVMAETLDYWIGRDRPGVLELMHRAQGFVLTEREFRELWFADCGPGTPHLRVAPLLDEFGLRFLIVTFGERGSQIFDPEGAVLVPAVACNTVDPTGAGNAFSAGVLSALTGQDGFDREGLVDGVILGTALAALQVQDFGNQALRTASAATVQELYDHVRQRVRRL
jgi:sugar/nucleoside kinase (ribokinase family)